MKYKSHDQIQSNCAQSKSREVTFHISHNLRNGPELMLIQAVALVAWRAVSMKRVDGASAGPPLSGGRPFRNNREPDQTQALSQAVSQAHTGRRASR